MSLRHRSLVLVAAYKSRTIINWKPVAGASAYEYSVAGMTGKVEACSVELSGFDGSTDYVFRLKAPVRGEVCERFAGGGAQIHDTPRVRGYSSDNYVAS